MINYIEADDCYNCKHFNDTMELRLDGEYHKVRLCMKGKNAKHIKTIKKCNKWEKK